MKIIIKRNKKKINKEKLIRCLIIIACSAILLTVALMQFFSELKEAFGFGMSTHEYLLESYDKDELITDPYIESELTTAYEKLAIGGLDIATNDQLDSSKINDNLQLTSTTTLSANEIHFLYNKFYENVRFSDLLQLESRNPKVQYLQMSARDNLFIISVEIPNRMIEQSINGVPELFVVTCELIIPEEVSVIDLNSIRFNCLDEEKNAEVLEVLDEYNYMLSAVFATYYLDEFLTAFSEVFNCSFAFSGSGITFTPNT